MDIRYPIVFECKWRNANHPA